MKKPRLKEASVPSQFPNFPSYMSTPSTSSRKIRSEKQALGESKNVAKVLQGSQLEFEKQQATDSCSFVADKRKFDASQPLRQVYECEKKLRLLSVLRLKLHHKEMDISTFDTDWCQFHDDRNNINTVSVTLTTNDLSAARDYMPVTTYIAGYCSYTVTKKLSCLHCTERVVKTESNVDNFQNELIRRTSRGWIAVFGCRCCAYCPIGCVLIVINKILIRMSLKVLLATETMP